MTAKRHHNAKSITLSHDIAYQTAMIDGFALIDMPIDDLRLKKSLLDSSCGALATFEGWVRHHNNARPVDRLTYYGYEQLALNLGKKLVAQACTKFAIERAVAMHRIGDLAIGEMAVWIGVTARHRYPAFEACRWLLDAIKAEIPVWKQEFYTDNNESLWLSNNG